MESSSRASAETWHFAVVADMQRGSPRSYRYRPAFCANWQTAMAQLRELDPDLLLCAGDLTRDGNLHRYELEAMRHDLDSLPFPVRTVGGNTDTGNKHARADGPSRAGREPDTHLNVSSKQLGVFAGFFGPLYWTTVHRGVRFTGIADVILGSGLPEEAELWRWMEMVAGLTGEREHVWLMHYALFLDDLAEPTRDVGAPEEYLDWYFSVDAPVRRRLMPILEKAGVTRVITGHIHCRRHFEVGGIAYDFAPGTAFAQYVDRWPDGDGTLGFLDYEVDESGIACRFVPLRSAAEDIEGYGPGGHPPPDDRDYSLAWER